MLTRILLWNISIWILPNSDKFYSFGRIINRIRDVKGDNNYVSEILRLIEVFLVDKRATNLKNLITHGYYPHNANNIGYAILLVLILLKFSSLKIEKKEKEKIIKFNASNWH